MRKTLIIASLAMGTAAMAATRMPADARQLSAKSHLDLTRQAFVNDAPIAAMPKGASAPLADDRVVYDYENVVVGTSAYDYQHNGSMGKMIAVGADGVAHGAFMGGTNEDTGRRVKAWCVSSDLSIPNPTANVANIKSGYATYAVTSTTPPNEMPANTGVVGYHRATASWFAYDFGDCSMAFQGLQHLNGAEIVWPHIAIDYQDKIHMVCGDAGTGATADAVWYDASTSGSSWDGVYNQVDNNCNTLGHTVTANKNGPGVALFYLPNAPASPDYYDDTHASQWHHDVFYYEATDANNDLHSVIDAGEPINLTQYNTAQCTAPFRVGVFAYSDVDAIYDSQETANLHIAFTAPMSYMDSMLFVENDTSFFNPMQNVQSSSAIYHCNAATGQWSHIAGWLTGDDEVSADPPLCGVFRTTNDRVQLAHDPSNGYLYALWNVYSYDDVRAPGADTLEMANGEIYMACSADNGATWGAHVNITNSPTPGCESPNCDSETFASLAEIVDGGFLHLTFMDDDHAGSFIRASDAYDGSLRTENNYYYMRVPVSAVPPTAEPWDAGGHIGLGKYSRTWGYNAGHPDTAQIVDKLDIFNEGSQDRYLVDLIMYHEELDVFGDSLSDLTVSWSFMDGDAVAPGEWHYKPLNQNHWNGHLNRNSITFGHVSIAHRGLPIGEQAFKLVFSDGTERVYRYIYQSADFGPSLVEVLDLSNLSQYPSMVLYHNDGTNSIKPETPRSFNLNQNVPNPFNPSTSISFQLTSAGPVSLKVYDLNGATVANLIDRPMFAGQHLVNFDGSHLSSGVYFYTLEAGGVSETRKMLLTK